MGFEFVADARLESLGLQRFWEVRLPLDGDELTERLVRLDDNLYVLTTKNRAIAVHAHTGIIRWSNFVAEEGQTVRGPTHTARHVLFTAPGTVRLLDRESGESASEHRRLSGVVIETARDHVTISIGEDHGVSPGDVLGLFRPNEIGEIEGQALDQIRIVSVRPRSARGELQHMEGSQEPRAGDRVSADIVLPMRQVKLPFAASSAAVSDGESIFVGAANQRFYSLNIHGGTVNWQLLTPQTVSASPIVFKDDLYFAGQDGQVVCCTKQEKAKNWTFQTEAPIFADMVLDAAGLFVASSDRSLYLLDRESGRRKWRERFDTPLDEAPVVAGERIYQSVPNQGLYALEAKSGRRLWNRPEGGRFLIEIGEDAYILENRGSPALLRLNARNGRRKELEGVSGASFAAASPEEQMIFLGTATGSITCLRSRHAPRLTPAQVEAALRSTRKMQLAAQVEAERQRADKKATPAAERPPRGLFEDDDGLASRSTAQPVGGHRVLPLEVEKKKDPAAVDAQKPAAGEPMEEGEADEGAAEEAAEAEEAPDADAAAAEEGSPSKPAEEEKEKEEEEGEEQDEGGG